MSQLDELLERSRAPGAFVERRHFTLSRDKAIEKQREFALRHPRQYVLEIIQGAIFAGATYMAVDARKHDILIAWVGAPPLKREELERLFDYLFADRSDPRTRHLVQLAVGINALLQRKPQGITIESGAGGRTIRFDMKPDGEADIGQVENPIDGTYLVARFDQGWFGRFFGASSETQVTELIEKRCLYTPVPILLNGNAPFGFRASRNIEIFGARDQEQFDQGDRRGVVAVHTSPHAPKGFRIVVGGVWVTDLLLEPLATQPLVGVICDDTLRKTADHSDIVQDVRYQRMLHAVQPHATKLLKRVAGAQYAPPQLPAVPDEIEPDAPGEGPRVVYEPLEEVIAMVGPRGVTSLPRLESAGDEPLFWCTAEVAEQLKGDAGDPLRFPFRVIVLTEGQANTLARSVSGVHRLNSPSDIDFVLRVMERGRDVREITVPTPHGSLTLRLHRAGRLPAWGNGANGIPVLVRFDRRTQSVGVVDDTRVHLSRVPPYELSLPVDLPGVSLVIETRKDAPWLDDEIARRALDAAWQLVVPDEGAEPGPLSDVDTRLLAALLANQSLPQLSEDPHPVGRTHAPDAVVRISASLPPSWPPLLRQIPLVETNRGPLGLDGFLALVQSGEVAWVRDKDALARMEPLEARFGFGHLALHGVDEAPLFAVVRTGDRWSWVSDKRFWSRGPHISHIVFIGHHLAPRTTDATWRLAAQPFPEIVAIARNEAPDVDYAEAWEILHDGLRRLELENGWSKHSLGRPVERARSLGRLALMHLATWLDEGPTRPLLLPSDGGARWSVERLRSDRAARVAAANGIQVVEPHTFLLTLDELRAVAGDHPITLRYDDHPDVWRSLAATSDEGWLIRTEIKEARLRGWLGLRLPFDATCGILLRTTGELVALPELDERIPCHGLLWPAQGHHVLTTDERQLLQLAGLRLYAQLHARLRERLDPEVARAGQLYAWSFCWRAHRRGRLSGTALQLARQVEVRDTDGRTWGTLDRWLETPAQRRPTPPPEVQPPPEPVEAPPAARIEGPKLSSLTDRMNAALPDVDVEVTAGDLGRAAPVLVEPASSGRARLIVTLNTAHALARDGLVPGVSQELLLLEVARKVALSASEAGTSVDLLRVQQVLLSQRLED